MEVVIIILLIVAVFVAFALSRYLDNGKDANNPDLSASGQPMGTTDAVTANNVPVPGDVNGDTQQQILAEMKKQTKQLEFITLFFKILYVIWGISAIVAIIMAVNLLNALGA